MRSLGTDVLVETLRKAVKVMTNWTTCLILQVSPLFLDLTSTKQWVCKASLGDAAVVGRTTIGTRVF